MKKTIMRLGLVSMLVMVAGPSYSVEAWHVFTCEQLEEATEKDIIEGASKWLKAAKGMKGGENVELEVYFPVAAQMGESDFVVFMKFPTFAEWGVFFDGYEGSPAAEVDKEVEAFADCTDSALWEAVKAE